VTKLRDRSSIVLSPELPDRPVAEDIGHAGALTLHRVKIIRDPAEPTDGVVAILTPGWRSSVPIQKAILRARRQQLPLYLIDPTMWSLKAS
jgi:hypothetical protein